MKDWERLSAVAIGPLLERRSLRQIDFTPTRPELIARAVERAPADAADMERIGTPAKGLPALEYLLWTKPVKPGSAECRYAQQVAADIDREAQALEQGFAQAAGREWDDEAAVAAMSEALNQWVGGLERLRWAEIERPVRARSSGGRDAAVFPRAASAQSAAELGLPVVRPARAGRAHGPAGAATGGRTGSAGNLSARPRPEPRRRQARAGGETASTRNSSA